MRILLIAHYFPPDGGPGTQRPASFARHLRVSGHEVVVITRAIERAARSLFDPLDTTMMNGLEDTRIERASLGADGSWSRAIAAKAKEVCTTWTPDVVLATLSPFEHASTAFALREQTGAPAVLDLRDPWALDGWMVHRHWLDYRRELRRMRTALTHADGVIANVPGARDAMQRIAPRTRGVDYTVVTNGWEEIDFPSLTAVPVGTEWRLRLSGTFVSSDFVRYPLLKRAWRTLRVSDEQIDGRGRSPFFLLGALQELRTRGHACGRDAVLEIAGTVDRATQQLIDDSGFADRVRVLGFLPHHEAVTFAANAHALVLPMHDVLHGARARMVPGKLYEYFATGRPILGLTPEGDAKDWIATDSRSRTANPCSRESISLALVAMHDEWSRGLTAESVRIPLAPTFTRSQQTAQLVEYLKQIVASRTTRSC